MNIEQTITAVESGLSSIYSKEDVLSLLRKLEPISNGELIKEVNINISENFKSALKRTLIHNPERIIDYDSVEMDLRGNEIIITDIPVDVDAIVELLNDCLPTLEPNS